MQAEGCYYASMFGQAFGYSQLIPFLITLNLTVMSMVTSEIIFLFYGLFLHFMSYVLWVIQYYFKIKHINPICQQYNSYVFPQMLLFYSFSLVAFVYTYSFWYKKTISWYQSLFLVAIASAPIFILISFEYNTMTQILISAGIGILSTFMFVTVLYIFIQPSLPFILTTFPVNWMGYTDNYIMEGDCKEEYFKYVKRKKK